MTTFGLLLKVMGKGLSKRHREKRATKANEGNLHKQARGKVSGRAFEPLPKAPKDDELKEDVTYMPKSLQKLLKVKAAAESGAPRHRITAKAPSTTENKNHAKESKGKDEAVAEEPSRRNEADTRGLEPSSLSHHQSKNGLFQAKTLKQSKKDYLNRKKLKKKGKGKTDTGTALEESMKVQQRVAFGEQSSQPPEVSLKRKSWTTKEKTQGERCKDLFLKQMNEAQAKAAPGGLQDQGVQKKGQVMSDSEREDLRSKAIEAYRAAKSRGGKAGGATLNSLKALVAAKSGGQ